MRVVIGTRPNSLLVIRSLSGTLSSDRTFLSYATASSPGVSRGSSL